eukprot:249872-Chlamydomonas_euryale.AAC.1
MRYMLTQRRRCPPVAAHCLCDIDQSLGIGNSRHETLNLLAKHARKPLGMTLPKFTHSKAAHLIHTHPSACLVLSAIQGCNTCSWLVNCQPATFCSLHL